MHGTLCHWFTYSPPFCLPGNLKNLSYSLTCFIWSLFVFSIQHIMSKNHTAFVFLHLTYSTNIIPFRSIHAAAMAVFQSFEPNRKTFLSKAKFPLNLKFSVIEKWNALDKISFCLNKQTKSNTHTQKKVPTTTKCIMTTVKKKRQQIYCLETK